MNPTDPTAGSAPGSAPAHKPGGMRAQTYRVRQTDCRTGWQVIGMNGRPIATYRQNYQARDHAESLNA